MKSLIAAFAANLLLQLPAAAFIPDQIEETGRSISADLYRCPEVTEEMIKETKNRGHQAALKTCGYQNLHQMKDWQIDSYCEETTCCFGETTYTRVVEATTSFLCLPSVP